MKWDAHARARSGNIGNVVIPTAALRLAICVVALTGCELAHNYLDPDGPRYAGDYAEPTPRPADTLLVVTYNLAYALEIDRAIAVLRAPPLANADIVLMQEMDYRGSKVRHWRSRWRRGCASSFQSRPTTPPTLCALRRSTTW